MYSRLACFATQKLHIGRVCDHALKQETTQLFAPKKRVDVQQEVEKLGMDALWQICPVVV